MQPDGQIELTAAQQELMGKLASAKYILFERTSNGTRLVIDFDGRHTQGMQIAVADFGAAIRGLVAGSIDRDKVSRVLMERVSPQNDFASPGAVPVQFFRIESYDAGKKKFGTDGLQYCEQAAAKLASRLQIA